MNCLRSNWAVMPRRRSCRSCNFKLVIIPQVVYKFLQPDDEAHVPSIKHPMVSVRYMSIHKKLLSERVKVMSILKEFKVFAMRGNVVDMAVGIIIGGAFGKIITSLVNDIIMPPIGLLIGGVDFVDLKFILKEASIDAAGKEIPAVAVNYGVLANATINFLIIAFTIFVAIKALNSLKKKEVAAPPAPPTPSAEEKLLTEIRDILSSK